MPLVSSVVDMGNKLTDSKLIQKICHFVQHDPSSAQVCQLNKMKLAKIGEESSQRQRHKNQKKVSISSQLAASSTALHRPTKVPLDSYSKGTTIDPIIRDGGSAIVKSNKNTDSNKYEQRRHRLPPAVGVPPVWQTVYGSIIDKELYYSGFAKPDNRSTRDTQNHADVIEQIYTGAIAQKDQIETEYKHPRIFRTEPMSSMHLTDRGIIFESKNESNMDDNRDFLSSSQIFRSMMNHQNLKEADSQQEFYQNNTNPQVPSVSHYKDKKSFRTPGELTTKPSTIAETSKDYSAKMNSARPRDQFIYTEENPQASHKFIDTGRSEHPQFIDSHRENSNNLRSIDFYQPSSYRKTEGNAPQMNQQLTNETEKKKKHQQVTFQKRKDSNASQSSRHSKYSNEGWRIDSINQKLATHKKIKDELSHGLMMTSTGNLYSIFLKS